MSTPQEPVTQPSENPVVTEMFTKEQLEAARKQEKDKLYSQIQTLQEQQKQANDALQALQDAKAAELAEIQKQQAQRDAELQAKKEEEMSAKALLEQKLRETNDTWESRFNQLQQEREVEKALHDKERQYNELTQYRNSELEAAQDSIAPQFYDFISGDTKEQIDAGIARAKAATESIAEQFKAAQATQLSQMRGVSPTGYAAAGPMDNNSGYQQLTPEAIAAMDMKQFAELRKKTGIGNAEARSNRGLFG